MTYWSRYPRWIAQFLLAEAPSLAAQPARVKTQRRPNPYVLAVLEVPKIVDDAIDSWRRRGGQRPIAWSRDVWIRQLGHRPVLQRLPDAITRGAVTSIVADVADEKSAEDAFVAAMVWGFGTVGYGAWRTRRILDENPEAGARLHEVYRAVRAGGGPAGFDDMARQPLAFLGVAFGTKYLFFCAQALSGVEPAPVLDRVIRSWFAENLNRRLGIWSWRDAEPYREYCRTLSCWATARDLEVGEVEEAIFVHATHGPERLRDVGSTLDDLAAAIESSQRLGPEGKSEASEHLERLSELLEDEEATLTNDHPKV